MCVGFPRDFVRESRLGYVVGSILHLDEWKAYAPLRNNPDYTYASVNHSKYFVDPVTRVHTQSIENTWMRAKWKQKKQTEICRSLLPTYIEEFV